MNPFNRDHSIQSAGVPHSSRYVSRPIRPYLSRPAAARAPELLHGFHLRAGNLHVVAAIHDALGEQQIRVLRDIRMGNPALVQRAENLLGADYSSVNIGETIIHRTILPFNRLPRRPSPRTACTANTSMISFSAANVNSYFWFFPYFTRFFCFSFGFFRSFPRQRVRHALHGTFLVRLEIRKPEFLPGFADGLRQPAKQLEAVFRNRLDL